MKKVVWPAMLAVLTFVRAAPCQSRLWRADERVTISSFNEIGAIAYDGRRVLAATPNGLEIYDEMTHRWLEPSTVEDGYPAFGRPLAMAYDRRQGGVWLRTDRGVFFQSELTGRWDARPFGFEESGLNNNRIPENDVAWRVLRSSITVDAQMRRWPLTALVGGDREGTYWVGTGGGNIVHADSRNLSSEWYRFGALARGAGAIAVDANNNIWIGGDGFGPRDGITRADQDLQNWTWYESYSSRAPRTQVTRLLFGTDRVWAAAADGLYVLIADARAWRRIGEHEGLLSDNVRAIAQTSAGVWVGTAHGVALIDPGSLRVTSTSLEPARITGLAARNDTVWISGTAGLMKAMVREGIQVLPPEGNDATLTLRGTTAGVAALARTIYTVASDGLWALADDVPPAPVRNATLTAIGRLYDVRASGDMLFVFGARGIARLKNGEWSYLTIPTDIPDGPIRDVAVAGKYVWVATPSGATRVVWP